MINRLIKKYTWSKWQDLEIGRVHEYYYLLQFRRRGCGKVQFKVRKNRESCWGTGVPTLELLQTNNNNN